MAPTDAAALAAAPHAYVIAAAGCGKLAIEHGVGIASFDSDFARFPELAWVNPGTRST